MDLLAERADRSQAETASSLQSEMKKWGDLIRDAGIKAE